MMIKNFKWIIFSQVIGMLLLMALLLYSISQGFYFSALFFGVLLSLLVYGTLYYVDRTNRDLTTFFNGIQFNDYSTISIPASRGTTYSALKKAMQVVQSKFREVQSEKEANHQFLQTMVEYIDIGLLCVRPDGTITLMNEALKGLLQKPYLLQLADISKVDQLLWKGIQSLAPQERKVIRWERSGQMLQLAIQRIDLQLKGEELHLYSFQNIRTELEEQELVAWKKLIRILTHEIMNSVAPIASLSGTSLSLLAQADIPKAELEQALSVIQRRSEGLLAFTDTYRSLTRLPKPQFQQVHAQELAQQLTTLFQAELDEKAIHWQLQLPTTPLYFRADPYLLEQVLINLIRNAIEAVADQPDPSISLAFRQTPPRTIIQLTDNGMGMSKAVLDQIFIPFFTTKQEGSGIGLSLSRQIIQLHKGQMEVQSEEGAGTRVGIVL